MHVRRARVPQGWMELTLAIAGPSSFRVETNINNRGR
mgnify:CR=1 FL=1